jgi:hypothetical protein
VSRDDDTGLTHNLQCWNRGSVVQFRSGFCSVDNKGQEINRHNSSGSKVYSIPVEEDDNMKMAKNSMIAKVKGLVGGEDHNLQC